MSSTYRQRVIDSLDMLPIEVIDNILKFDINYIRRRSCERLIVKFFKRFNLLKNNIKSKHDIFEDNYHIVDLPFVAYVRIEMYGENYKHNVMTITPSFGNFWEKKQVFKIENAESRERYREYKIMTDVKDYFRPTFRTKLAKTKMLKQFKSISKDGSSIKEY